jgi:hypothetical protein
MLVNPGQATHVETTASARDRDVGETGLGVVDRAGQSTARVVTLIAVFGRGEVVSDFHPRPFTPFGLVSGGDGHLGLRLEGELRNSGENGARAMGVEKVDQRQQIPSGRIVGSVVLQFTPRREQEQFGMSGAAAFLEVTGSQGQGAQAVPSPGQGR